MHELADVGCFKSSRRQERDLRLKQDVRSESPYLPQHTSPTSAYSTALKGPDPTCTLLHVPTWASRVHPPADRLPRRPTPAGYHPACWRQTPIRVQLHEVQTIDSPAGMVRQIHGKMGCNLGIFTQGLEGRQPGYRVVRAFGQLFRDPRKLADPAQYGS